METETTTVDIERNQILIEKVRTTTVTYGVHEIIEMINDKVGQMASLQAEKEKLETILQDAINQGIPDPRIEE